MSKRGTRCTVTSLLRTCPQHWKFQRVCFSIGNILQEYVGCFCNQTRCHNCSCLCEHAAHTAIYRIFASNLLVKLPPPPPTPTPHPGKTRKAGDGFTAACNKKAWQYKCFVDTEPQWFGSTRWPQNKSGLDALRPLRPLKNNNSQVSAITEMPLANSVHKSCCSELLMKARPLLQRPASSEIPQVCSSCIQRPNNTTSTSQHLQTFSRQQCKRSPNPKAIPLPRTTFLMPHAISPRMMFPKVGEFQLEPLFLHVLLNTSNCPNGLKLGSTMSWVLDWWVVEMARCSVPCELPRDLGPPFLRADALNNREPRSIAKGVLGLLVG